MNGIETELEVMLIAFRNMECDVSEMIDFINQNYILKSEVRKAIEDLSECHLILNGKPFRDKHIHPKDLLKALNLEESNGK